MGGEGRLTLCPYCKVRLERETHIDSVDGQGHSHGIHVLYWCEDCGWQAIMRQNAPLDVIHDAFALEVQP